MQVYCVIVLLAVVGVSIALPANKNFDNNDGKEMDKEVDFVPLGNKNVGAFPPGGVIDVDAGGFPGENPFAETPFTSSFSSLEAAFARMRRLMNQLLGRLPSESSGSIPDFPELHVPNFGNIDLGKGNTTSVTKVINGHKVTINDTEYKSDEGNGSSFYKVHIVEVHPDTEDTKPDTLPNDATNNEKPAVPPKRDPESVEETLNNEIPKIKDNEDSKLDENIETFDERDVAPPQRWNKVTDVETFEDNRIDSAPSKPYDLSNDIYVNQLLADSGAKTNPDAEIFDPSYGRGSSSAQYYAVPSRTAQLYYPNNMYQQPNQQFQYNNPSLYAPPIASDNRFPREQIMIVPLDNYQQSYFVPAHDTSSSTQTQGINSIPQTVTSISSKTSSSAPSTT